MNAIEACKEINRIAELPHKQSKALIDAVKVGVKQMLFTSDFYENDIVNVFTNFCESGKLDFRGIPKTI